MHIIVTAKSIEENEVYADVELDSHADSAVVCQTAQIIERTGKRSFVTGFTDSLGNALLVEIVHACVLYDCERSRKSYLLVIINALYVPEMKECLIHPIMMRLVGLEVDERPKFLSKVPSENCSIYFPKNQLRILFKLSGIVSYINCRRPSEGELTDNDGILELIPNIYKLNPRSMELYVHESSMLDFEGNIKEEKTRNFIISAVSFRDMDPMMFSVYAMTYVGMRVPWILFNSHRNGISVLNWQEEQ